MDDTLNVWFQDHLAGELSLQDGNLVFSYNQDYLKNPSAMPLSHSLPLQAAAYGDIKSRAFFSGLLPEGEQRIRIAKILQASAHNDFSILRAIGGECAGAVSLLPPGARPKKEANDVQWLDEGAVKQIIDELPARPMLVGEKHSVRLSLAGAQDKLPVVYRNGKIGIPLNNTPSTHILKPAIRNMEGVVFNEAFCLAVANKLNLHSVQAVIKTAGNTPYLLIERYDRKTDDKGTHRLHQEDFCQALGVLPDMKYEVEHGPGIEDCAALIREVINDEDKSILQFIDIVLYNCLIGNNDAHGKNFSLIYHDTSNIELSPFYDILCTEVYEGISRNMAMKIDGKSKFEELEIMHFSTLADKCGIEKNIIIERLRFLNEELQNKSKEVIQEFILQNLNHPIFSKINTIIEFRTSRIKNKLMLYNSSSHLDADIINYKHAVNITLKSKQIQLERIEIALDKHIRKIEKRLIEINNGEKVFFDTKENDNNLLRIEKRLIQLKNRRSLVQNVRSKGKRFLRELSEKKVAGKLPFIAAKYREAIQLKVEKIEQVQPASQSSRAYH